MSDLQLSLIVLALIAIGAVWLFNALVERRRRKVFEQRFRSKPSDAPAMGAVAAPAVRAKSHGPAVRSEPSFNDELASADASTTPSNKSIDASDASLADGAEEAGATSPQVIDDAIHAVVTLEPEGQISGERALSLLHAFRHAGRQPVMLVGVKVDAQGDLQEPLRAGERYDAVLVAVQLANRSGPLNEIEWSEFVAALAHVAEQIPATCEVPDMRETTARARALDALCVPLDAQIGINLASAQDGWTGEHVAALAREQGLILRPDGRFHALDDRGATLVVLQNGDGGAFRADTLDAQHTSRLTLLLDVPRAPENCQPFERLVVLAHKLAGLLDATIVDDQSRLLTLNALSSIGRQIEPVYAKLAEAGMPAGSPRALALFG
ncbi:MAG: cell division protein ZipA C-terminal FtsZ-binding domain-containing protein [Burkholderiaceae bacterium]